MVLFSLSRVAPKLKHKAEVRSRLSVSVRRYVRQPFVRGLVLLYVTRQWPIYAINSEYDKIKPLYFTPPPTQQHAQFL